MTHEELVAHCLGRPGAVPDTPWEGGLKCGHDADEAGELRLRFPDSVSVSHYIGRYGWNAVTLDGAIDDEELREFVDASCDAVVAKPPPRLRPA